MFLHRLSLAFNRVFKGRSYLKSSHVAEYEKIAAQFDVDPEYVYKLAHSQRRRRAHRIDRVIVTELKIKKILVSD